MAFATASSTLIPSTTTTSSIQATVTQLLSLTTPFVERPECTTIWDVTSITYFGTTELLLASDSADARFAACQPSGWENVVPESRFSFSPAVCPSGWNALSLATIEEWDTSKQKGRTVSTAYCCLQGHTLGLASDLGMSPPCIRDISPETVLGTLSHGTGPTTSLSYGFQAHHAWHISWEASDTSTLSPKPPPLTVQDALYPLWVPGTKLNESTNSRSPSMDSRGWSSFYFLVIGVPLITVSIFVGCCCCACCWHDLGIGQRDRRRAEQTANPATNPTPNPEPEPDRIPNKA